jgi:hypothetical protein
MMNRRQFLCTSAASAATFACIRDVWAATYDLLIKGGRVIDPSVGLDAVRDVAIVAGKIAAVDADIRGDATRRPSAPLARRATYFTALSSSATSLLSRLAAFVRSPFRKAPFRGPSGAPEPNAPPCIRHRRLPWTEGAWHARPDLVRAPQRGEAFRRNSQGPVGHTFLSFIFDNAPPLSISIETRPEVGQGFAPVASLFKQFELIYVVGDERDLVRVRTNYRREVVYLYRLNTSADDARRLFLVYLARINELADRPEFYNLLTNSCTINIVRYANAAGRVGQFDIRHLLNGLVDSYLYHSGRIDTTLPFDELRRRSLINEAAQAADGAPDFSQRIRASLPTIFRGSDEAAK